MSEQVVVNGKSVTYHRKGNLTSVIVDGEYIGYIKRQMGSNSSPRGGAYRTHHYPVLYEGRRRLAACWTRKEATEDMLRVLGF